jgi:hypothetical protein
VLCPGCTCEKMNYGIDEIGSAVIPYPHRHWSPHLRLLKVSRGEEMPCHGWFPQRQLEPIQGFTYDPWAGTESGTATDLGDRRSRFLWGLY